MTRAAPAWARASALRRWWSSAARGNGTNTAGLPAAVTSATVLAPERHSSRSARAKAPGMSSMKGETSAEIPACKYAAWASL